MLVSGLGGTVGLRRSQLDAPGTPADEDVLVDVTVRAGGFDAADQCWVVGADWDAFLEGFRVLEASRQGAARLVSASPGDLELEFYATDRAGHMAVRGQVRRRTTDGFELGLTFGFAFEPDELPQLLRELLAFRSSDRFHRQPSASPEASLLSVLALIRTRPAMYLGWDESNRDKQLSALQAVLSGYALALNHHGIGNDDVAVLTKLETFIREKSGADNLTGIDHLLAVSGSPQAVWNAYWALVDEFLGSTAVASKARSLPNSGLQQTAVSRSLGRRS